MAEYKGILHRFRRRRKGVATIEFAIILFPFFLVVSSTLEVGLMAFNLGVMKRGLQVAVRDTRVGTSNCMTEAQVVKKVCSIATMLQDCENNLSAERMSFPNGWGPDMRKAMSQAPGFGNTGAGDIVLVQMKYKWKPLTPGLSIALTGGKSHLEIRRFSALQAESYQRNSCG